LYLAYYAPHVPTASSKKYLDRFPGEMAERRRYGLAMISAIDDGVGAILKKLDEHKIDENTLVVFISDNGAPLKLTMKDDPIHLDGPYWDGSKNTPLNGEKGMLAEGGIRVPYLMRWKGTIPPAQVNATPVTTLDFAPTALAAAKAKAPTTLDGQNLLPLLVQRTPLPERTLYWRFWNQSAARKGDWKLLRYGSRASFLFNVAQDKEEKRNLIDQHPGIAKELEQSLTTWGAQLKPAGFPSGIGQGQSEAVVYHHFFQVPKP
jgi:arylsulfatase A-like enzyme